MPPVINDKLCKKCGKCYEICPNDVFSISKKGEVPVVMYPNECWHEGACIKDCPTKGAIKLRIPIPMTVVCK
jgi:adenylylsulfate reductase subunit B